MVYHQHRWNSPRDGTTMATVAQPSSIINCLDDQALQTDRCISFTAHQELSAAILNSLTDGIHDQPLSTPLKFRMINHHQITEKGKNGKKVTTTDIIHHDLPQIGEYLYFTI